LEDDFFAMSRRQYFMRASKNQANEPDHISEPVVNRFSDIQKIDERRHEILDYLIVGLDGDKIAEIMGVHLSTVQEDIKQIYRIGYQAKDEDVEEVRTEIMHAYRLVKKEAFSAFKSSQGETEKIVVEEQVSKKNKSNPDLDDERPKINNIKTTTEFQAGDPRFLNVIIDSAKEMGKVSGAQKHKEVSIQNTIQNNQAMTILSPNRTKLPKDFDQWTKKPEGAEVPDASGINSEDL